ncbi:MAG: hypothetical protein IMZ61_05570, partial [Planctomycetes bacterium]|nr:hypothetical protein [Planctomycetota bacterium]
MKRIFFLLVFVAAMAAWCTPSFAAPARETFNGASIFTMTAIGELGGVDMTGQGGGGTLNVGVAGTQMDVFSANNPLGTWPGVAISTDDVTSNLSDIVFLGSSNVYGDIGLTLPAGPYFRNIFAQDAGATVNFSGSVFARTLNVGTGTVNFNSGTITNAAAANFTGDGKISLAANTTVTGALTTAAGAQTGTLELGSESHWLGAVGGAVGLRAINVVGGDNTAGVSASITGAVDTYSLSLGTNTLNITGALTLHDAGVIDTTLASPTVYGKIIPTGFATIGATLGVDVTVPSTAYIPVGTLFNIVDATSGTDGSVVTVTVQDPTNPLYKFSADPLTGTTVGKVTIKTDTIPMMVPIAPPPGVVLPPVAPIAAPVVPVLIAIPTPS